MAGRRVKRVKHLIKHHVRACTNRGKDADLTQCDCEWSGKYKGYDYVLSKWADRELDPRKVGPALEALTRFKKAIDDREFSADGERPPVRRGATFSEFIDEWIDDYAKPQKLNMDGLGPQLSVIQKGDLGGMTNEQLAGNSERILKWLNSESEKRNWSDKTREEYRLLLHRLCKYATTTTVNNKPRMSKNPMIHIAARTPMQPEHNKRRVLLEDIEDKLFAKCDQLDRPQHLPNRNKLTQEKADAIRASVKKGTLQNAVAKTFKVSAAVVSAIMLGRIWNPAKYRVGTKGREMYRRLVAAFDLGLRRGEMMLVKLVDVDWKHPVRLTAPDGTKFNGYRITLPPANTKSGKSTGKAQVILAGTMRASKMLEERYQQLRLLRKDDWQQAFVFGTEQGYFQASFRRMWHELFELAGLDYGRAVGIVWHTTRHEHCSRVVEKTGNIRKAQKRLRHARVETTEGYAHDRDAEDWETAQALER